MSVKNDIYAIRDSLLDWLKEHRQRDGYGIVWTRHLPDKLEAGRLRKDTETHCPLVLLRLLA